MIIGQNPVERDGIELESIENIKFERDGNRMKLFKVIEMKLFKDCITLKKCRLKEIEKIENHGQCSIE